MQSDSKEFEVLLEVDKSSRILKVTPDTLLVAVESELGNIGLDICLLPFYATKEELKSRSKVPYKLQRWAEKFNSYVDVTHESQVNDGDRLTVKIASTSTDSDAGSSRKVVCVYLLFG